MSKLSPTQRTLRALEQRGCHCGIVERFNSFAGPNVTKTDQGGNKFIGRSGIRIDLFGIIDLIALYPNRIVGVQCCGSDFAEHDRKILDSPLSVEWLKSGGDRCGIELWAWRKIKKERGGKLMIWKPRVKEYCLEDF